MSYKLSIVKKKNKRGNITLKYDAYSKHLGCKDYYLNRVCIVGYHYQQSLFLFYAGYSEQKIHRYGYTHEEPTQKKELN